MEGRGGRASPLSPAPSPPPTAAVGGCGLPSWATVVVFHALVSVPTPLFWHPQHNVQVLTFSLKIPIDGNLEGTLVLKQRAPTSCSHVGVEALPLSSRTILPFLAPPHPSPAPWHGSNINVVHTSRYNMFLNCFTLLQSTSSHVRPASRGLLILHERLGGSKSPKCHPRTGILVCG